MEVQERIKKVDASFAWPHPTDKGYFVSATFVRTEDDTPYLLYCPKASTSISIDEETFNPYFLITASEDFSKTKTITLTQKLYPEGQVDTLFYLLRLGAPIPTVVKKKNIEKMFGVKVVE